MFLPETFAGLTSYLWVREGYTIGHERPAVMDWGIPTRKWLWSQEIGLRLI